MNFNIAVREPTPPSFKGLSYAKTGKKNYGN